MFEMYMAGKSMNEIEYIYEPEMLSYQEKGEGTYGLDLSNVTRLINIPLCWSYALW